MLILAMMVLTNLASYTDGFTDYHNELIFTREDKPARMVLPPETVGLIEHWFPKSLGVGNQNGLFNEKDTLLDFNVPIPSKHNAMFAYNQDLRKMLVIVDTTTFDDGTVIPRAICHVVYTSNAIPEPASILMIIFAGLFCKYRARVA